MSTELKASCKQILQRLQQQEVAEFACVVCAQQVRGQDALMQHLITEHQIHCVHFDNVSDLGELLAHLSTLLHSGAAPESWTCPVCSEDSGSADPAVLLQHLQGPANHSYWNPQTIPSMAPWCVLANGESAPVTDEARHASAAPQLADDADDAAWDDLEDEEVDEDEDWNLSCVCLYCNYDGEDILDHLRAVHDFDFRATVRQRTDLKSEYDLIRLVNVVRRAVAADRCPFDASCGVDGRHNDRAALEAHLMAEKSHRLPARVSDSDADLIPVLPGDAFLSMLVTSGEGFLNADEADPDFPMVPTVQELAAAKREAM